MVHEEEYRFDENGKVEKPSAIKGFAKFLWNSETKEFCGRDGASWGKVSLFYAVFYACLGSFFVGMLAVFMSIMPRDKPTYYGESSTMNARKINPGLGFRPQVDVEDHLIFFDPKVVENGKNGFKQYVDNLNHFLDKKYPTLNGDSGVLECQDGNDYSNDLKSGKVCNFNYKKIFETTDCQGKYGYDTYSPCVLLKLNKIIDWTPKVSNDLGNIQIECHGETAVDVDNVVKIVYHSEGNLNSTNFGLVNKKYFPFFGQKTYQAPFIFVQVEVKPNVLVNIECKAYADNIDNEDRLNKRGMTKFSFFVVKA